MDYSYSSSLDAGAVIGLFIVYAVVFIIGYAWFGLALGRVFAKLGQPSWKAWVPILNLVTLWSFGGFTSIGLIILGILVSPAGLVFSIISYHRINERFGKGIGYTVVAVLWPLIWMSILGFGKALPIGGAPSAQQPLTPAAPTASIPAPAWAAQPATPAATPAASFAPPVVPAAPVAEVPTPPAPVETPAAPVETPAAPAVADPWAPPISNVPGIATPAAPVVPPAATPYTPPAAPTGLISPPPLVEPGTPIAAAPVTAPVATPEPAPVVVPEPVATPAVEPEPAFDEPDGDFDATVIVRKRSASWTITPEAGAAIALTGDVVILGRNPSATTQSSGAQLVALDDPSKTVSKSHARITRDGDSWSIVDLKSTNGVYLLDAAGTETELEAGVSTPLTESFKLGDLVVRISKGK